MQIKLEMGLKSTVKIIIMKTNNIREHSVIVILFPERIIIKHNNMVFVKNCYNKYKIYNY